MSSDSVTTGTAETAPDHVVAGVDVGDADLAALLRARLVEVEELLVSRLETGEDFLTEVALHLVTAGGKRFRPSSPCSPESSVRNPTASAWSRPPWCAR